MNNVKKQILDKELALHTFKVRSDRKALKNLLTDDFREIGASGAYFGMSEVLERLPTEQNFECHTQDLSFRPITLDVIQVVYRAFIKSNTSEEEAYSYRTSIWRKEGDNWRMCFHQGTKVAPFELSSQTNC
ncbi:DUF4440 domain-containing protein [Veronia pacifica]|uniref:DUF4440 domain-containing protein n=1 Tax=Veronia pacifica TaxID=1080227 RepID=A0A1C3EGB7_9GAMM|nr:DUF4440 domain-containing protein [Veronia pacifica]ODA32261.1 hypothetical protein A8L45_13800 [Veronia pacifica]